MSAMRMAWLAAMAAASGAMISTPAAAQSPALEYVQLAPRQGSEPRMRGGVPGRFDYYSLVLSWSPTFCQTAERPDASQCNRRDGRRFAFILHGLWPQYERGYPEYCPTGERPFVPDSTINRMADIMPSRNLTIHEYRKHGVCTGLGPDGYYALSRKLFEKIKVPQRFNAPDQNQMVDTSTVVSEFVAANPGLKPDMLAVVCGGAGNRLREIRVCFTQEGQFRSCGGNESQRRLCAAPRVFIPPVRESRGGPSQDRGPSGKGPMLPGPVTPGGRSL